MENINLIRKIAWDFWKTTRLEWDDLFQEAAIAYLEALKTYDPERGKITTHAWWCITNHLRNYLKEQEEYKSMMYGNDLVSIEDTELNPHPAQSSSEFWESLTEDSKIIADLVLHSAGLFVVLTAEQAEQRIYNVMKNNPMHKEASPRYKGVRSWPKSRIENGIQGLKLACQ